MNNGKIFGSNGALLNKPDPMKMGIEDVIALQDNTKGRGTGLNQTELLTVIIFELSRTKQFALAMSNRVTELEKYIEETARGNIRAVETNEQQTNNRAGGTASLDREVDGNRHTTDR